MLFESAFGVFYVLLLQFCGLVLKPIYYCNACSVLIYFQHRLNIGCILSNMGLHIYYNEFIQFFGQKMMKSSRKEEK